jgi:hypothetical protein
MDADQGQMPSQKIKENQDNNMAELGWSGILSLLAKHPSENNTIGMQCSRETYLWCLGTQWVKSHQNHQRRHSTTQNIWSAVWLWSFITLGFI